MSENATTQTASGSRLAGAKRRSLIVKRSVVGAGALAFAGLIPVVRAAHPGAQASSASATAAVPIAPAPTVVVYRQAGTQSYALAPGQLAVVQQAQQAAQAQTAQAASVATAVS